MRDCCESVNDAQVNECMCCHPCCCCCNGGNTGVGGADTGSCGNGCEFDTDMILWVLIIIVIVSCCK